MRGDDWHPTSLTFHEIPLPYKEFIYALHPEGLYERHAIYDGDVLAFRLEFMVGAVFPMNRIDSALVIERICINVGDDISEMTPRADMR